MQSRRIVIDANILIRAVPGIRVREIIERYCEEALQYLAELAPRRGIGEDVWRESLT